jgi:hypothetical protein
VTNFEPSKVVSRDALRAPGAQNYQYYTDNSAFGHSLEEPGNAFDYFVIPSRGATREFTTVSDLAVEILRTNPGLKDAGGQNYTVESLTRWIQLHGNNGDPLYDQRGVLCNGRNVMNRQALIHPGQVVRIPEITNPVTLAAVRPIEQCVEPGVTIAQAEVLLAPAVDGPTAARDRIEPTAIFTPGTARQTNGRFPYLAPGSIVATRDRGGLNSYILWHAQDPDRVAANGGSGYSPSDGTESRVRTGRRGNRVNGDTNTDDGMEMAYNVRNHGWGEGRTGALASSVGPRQVRMADGTTIALGAEFYRTIDRDVVQNPYYRSMFGTGIREGSTAQAVFSDVASTAEGIDALNMLTANFHALGIRNNELPPQLRAGAPAAVAGAPAAVAGAPALTDPQRRTAYTTFNLMIQNLANPIVWDNGNRDGLPGWNEIVEQAKAHIARLPEGDPTRRTMEAEFRRLGLEPNTPEYIGRDPNEFVRRARAIGTENLTRERRPATTPQQQLLGYFHNPYEVMIGERSRSEMVQEGLRVNGDNYGVDIDEVIQQAGLSDRGGRISYNTSNPWMARISNDPRFIRDMNNADDTQDARRAIRSAVNRAARAEWATQIPGFEEMSREQQRAAMAERLLRADSDARMAGSILRGARDAEIRAASGITRVGPNMESEQRSNDPDSGRNLVRAIGAQGNDALLHETLLLMTNTPGGAETLMRMGHLSTAGRDNAEGDRQARLFAGFESRDQAVAAMRQLARDFRVPEDRFTVDRPGLLDSIGDGFVEFLTFGTVRPGATRNAYDNQQEAYVARMREILTTREEPAYTHLMDYARRVYGNAAESPDARPMAALTTFLGPNVQTDTTPNADERYSARPEYTAWATTMARTSGSGYTTPDAVIAAAENQEAITRRNYTDVAWAQARSGIYESQNGVERTTVQPQSREQVAGVINGTAPGVVAGRPTVAAGDQIADSNALFTKAGNHPKDILETIANNKTNKGQPDPSLALVVLQRLHTLPALQNVIGNVPSDPAAAAALLRRLAATEHAPALVAALDDVNVTPRGGAAMPLTEFVVHNLNRPDERSDLARAANQAPDAVLLLQMNMGAVNAGNGGAAGGRRIVTMDGDTGNGEYNAALATVRRNSGLLSGTPDFSNPAVIDALAESVAAQRRIVISAGSNDRNISAPNYEALLAQRIASDSPSTYLDNLQKVLSGELGNEGMQEGVRAVLSRFAAGGDDQARLAQALLSGDTGALLNIAGTSQGRITTNALASLLSGNPQGASFNSLLADDMELTAADVRGLLSSIPTGPGRNAMAQSLLSVTNAQSPEESAAAIAGLQGQIQGLLSHGGISAVAVGQWLLLGIGFIPGTPTPPSLIPGGPPVIIPGKF